MNWNDEELWDETVLFGSSRTSDSSGQTEAVTVTYLPKVYI